MCGKDDTSGQIKGNLKPDNFQANKNGYRCVQQLCSLLTLWKL